MSEPTRTSLPEADAATRTSADLAGGFDGAIAAPAGYELLGEIGSGGMGIVYRARDLDLDREVAVKILRPHFASDSTAARRFLDEARITGRLQHPGIPAIYRVGSLADGRPFLAMKLIGGQTLDDKLKEVAAPEGENASPVGGPMYGMLDRLEAFLRRGRFLAIFEQIAQAVAYAHEQGVIHRDLKPANIMVGAFAEVQVMDWGIARSGDRRQGIGGSEPGALPATVEYSPSGEYHTPESDLTQAGAILGTPAYMPPEQAIGAVDQIGKHSDVFGLGAILCVILTGKPPYAAENAESNRQLAARAKLDDAFARLDASGAEPELVALAKHCLAAEPSERPRDAGEVAKAVATLRAAADERARQAEMDRARGEVKHAEEGKRRRVQWALAASVVCLLGVAGLAGWWVDHERTARRADQLAEEVKRDAEARDRDVEIQARRIGTERDVVAALNEATTLRESGWTLADDTERWAVPLLASRGSLWRAQALLVGGEPTDGLRALVARAEAEFHEAIKVRNLLMELDRIADSNELQLLIPVSFSSVTSRQYAAAFRKYGIDILSVPTAEAVAWVKGHRLRDRIATAIRTWQQSLPMSDVTSVMDPRLFESVAISAAVAGNPPIVALASDPGKVLETFIRGKGTHARLTAILNAVTEDPFVREWWKAIDKDRGAFSVIPGGGSRKWKTGEKTGAATLLSLLARPEIRHLSSRELNSLAGGLTAFPDAAAVLDQLLAIAYERFPGEFWVHFRLALRHGNSKAGDRESGFRHLTAAIALRPKSGMARSVMGMAILEEKSDDPTGLRWLRSAAEVDPTSAWPHMVLALHAFATDDWREAFRATKEAIRVDPEAGYFMISASILPLVIGDEPDGPPDGEILRFLKELIAIHPRHPGGYHLLGRYYLNTGDHREALVQIRKARDLATLDYPGTIVLQNQLKELEAEARWENKLPAVLRGELKLETSQEFAELASYCATFEKKYALATRFVIEGLKANPKFLNLRGHGAEYASWAVQAGFGRGADGAELSPEQRDEFRRMALQWMESFRVDKDLGLHFTAGREFAPVRDPKELARLPAAERAEWEKLWRGIVPPRPAPKKPSREPAPPPRPVKD